MCDSKKYMVAKDFNKYLDNTVNFSNGTKIHKKKRPWKG